MNEPAKPQWFFVVAREMAAQAPKPAEQLYAKLRRDWDDWFVGTPREYDAGVKYLAKLCGVC